MPGYPVIVLFDPLEPVPGLVDVIDVAEFAQSRLDFDSPAIELSPAVRQVVGVETWLDTVLGLETPARRARTRVGEGDRDVAGSGPEALDGDIVAVPGLDGHGAASGLGHDRRRIYLDRHRVGMGSTVVVGDLEGDLVGAQTQQHVVGAHAGGDLRAILRPRIGHDRTVGVAAGRSVEINGLESVDIGVEEILVGPGVGGRRLNRIGTVRSSILVGPGKSDGGVQLRRGRKTV